MTHHLAVARVPHPAPRLVPAGLLLSCGPTTRPMGDAAVILGPHTDAICPTPPVTYADFGEPFFATYCTRCHARSVVGADRNGAPADHNYESAADIRLWAHEIDQVAASGPSATNTAMPFTGLQPSLAERELLGQLLACGVPD